MPVGLALRKRERRGKALCGGRKARRLGYSPAGRERREQDLKERQDSPQLGWTAVLAGPGVKSPTPRSGSLDKLGRAIQERSGHGPATRPVGCPDDFRLFKGELS